MLLRPTVPSHVTTLLGKNLLMVEQVLLLRNELSQSEKGIFTSHEYFVPNIKEKLDLLPFLACEDVRGEAKMKPTSGRILVFYT